MSSTNIQLYIIPASDILNQFPHFHTLLIHWNLSWEDVVYAATNELISHINSGGYHDVIDDLGAGTPREIERALELDRFSVELANSFLDDCNVEDISIDDDEEGTFQELAAVLRSIFVRALIHIKHIFDHATACGIPSEIVIDRVVGQDIVIRVTYLILRQESNRPYPRKLRHENVPLQSKRSRLYRHSG